MISIKARGKQIVIRVPLSTETFGVIKQIPGKYMWEGNQVIIEPTGPNIDFLRERFEGATWDEQALKFGQVVDNLRANAIITPKRDSTRDFDFKTEPYVHQVKVFLDSRDKEYFALLMEQGTGKTKVILDTAAHLYSKGLICGLLIIAKNGVHRNWIDIEIPLHLPDWTNPICAAWSSQKGEKGLKEIYKRRDKPGLVIMAINVEALSTTKGYKACENFLLTFPGFAVVDESTCIKSVKAKRTKNVLKLRNYAGYRRILTGTPITKGPLDAYSQFAFLDEEILGFSSYYSYKARYAVLQDIPGKTFRGRPVQFVVGYQNLPELQAKIKEHSYRVLKKDCLDLPPKIYGDRIWFQMTDLQWKHYNDFIDDVVTEFQGRRITSMLVMTRLMRLHQIACGFLPPPEEQKKLIYGVGINPDGANPRIDALMEGIEEAPEGKIIIYANYRYSLNEIYKAICKNYGPESIATYAGRDNATGKSMSQDQRELAKAQFQDMGSKVRFLLGQTESLAYGHTLTAAETVLYYSNDYKAEVRWQSEDRPHRIGQTKSVLYRDVCGEDTVDNKIIDKLLSNYDIATQITGDEFISWIV